jgi:hypothetical protein
VKLIDKIKNLFRTRPATEAELAACAEVQVIHDRAEAGVAENPLYGNR